MLAHASQQHQEHQDYTHQHWQHQHGGGYFEGRAPRYIHQDRQFTHLCGYESTYRTFEDRNLEIRFLPSEGTGGFADPLRLYRILQIPAAIVADIDFLAKDGELNRILTELGMPIDQVGMLRSRAKNAVIQIRSSAASLDPNAIQKELNSLAQTPVDPANNGDTQLRAKLQRLIPDRLHDFKQRGLDAISSHADDGTSKTSLSGEVEAILKELQKVGLSLVPGVSLSHGCLFL